MVGMGFSIFAKYILDPAWFGYENLSTREVKDFLYIWSGVGNIVVCSLWFFFTVWVAKRMKAAIPERVEDLFDRLALPVDSTSEGGVESDGMQAKVLGMLCLVYGGFISLLGIIIPNPMAGRMCFFFCGFLIMAIGGLLYRAYLAKKRALS